MKATLYSFLHGSVFSPKAGDKGGQGAPCRWVCIENSETCQAFRSGFGSFSQATASTLPHRSTAAVPRPLFSCSVGTGEPQWTRHRREGGPKPAPKPRRSGGPPQIDDGAQRLNRFDRKVWWSTQVDLAGRWSRAAVPPAVRGRLDSRSSRGPRTWMSPGLVAPGAGGVDGSAATGKTEGNPFRRCAPFVLVKRA